MNFYLYVAWIGLILCYGNLQQNQMVDEYFRKGLNYIKKYINGLDWVTNICDRIFPKRLFLKYFGYSTVTKNTNLSEKIYRDLCNDDTVKNMNDKDALYSVNKVNENSTFKVIRNDLDDITEEELSSSCESTNSIDMDNVSPDTSTTDNSDTSTTDNIDRSTTDNIDISSINNDTHPNISEDDDIDIIDETDIKNKM